MHDAARSEPESSEASEAQGRGAEVLIATNWIAA
jgi:hypothetical protein